MMGADICFWEELAIKLEALFRKALSNGMKRIVLADPGRQPFLDLAERCKDFARVDLREWYVRDPDDYDGYILDLKPRRKSTTRAK
jgi:predicted nicotinamide N-methyase